MREPEWGNDILWQYEDCLPFFLFGRERNSIGFLSLVGRRISTKIAGAKKLESDISVYLAQYVHNEGL